MGYLHIDNLYKNQQILMFKECYALEKIHGTSAHVSYRDGSLKFFSGGESHDRFVKLFNQEHIKQLLEETGINAVTFYGEAYGGKQQGMRDTYGEHLKFVVFDVSVGDYWLSVNMADSLARQIGFEFVYYQKIACTVDELDKAKNMFSPQAKRNGIEEDKMQEGIVVRPLIELCQNNGDRIIVKHKNDEFRETKTKRVVTDVEKLKVLEDAKVIAEEWVTPMRLNHILGKIPDVNITHMGNIIKSMIEDVKREGASELVWSREVERAIGKATALMGKEYFKSLLRRSLDGNRRK